MSLIDNFALREATCQTKIQQPHSGVGHALDCLICLDQIPLLDFETILPSVQAVSWCDNEKHWTQIFVKGAHGYHALFHAVFFESTGYLSPIGKKLKERDPGTQPPVSE